MKFTDDHAMFRDSVRSYIERAIDPYVDEWEEGGGFPARQVYAGLGAEGFLGLSYPARYGGLELDFSYTVIWMEELGRIRAGGIPMSVSVQTEIATPALASYGSDELKERYLKPAILGDSIAALAVTEPQAGSDVAAIQTAARREGNEYVITGKKSYITNGSIADFVVVLCRTSEDAGIRGMSLLIVPRGVDGFSASASYRKLGNHSCDHAELTFAEVRIPRENVIGEEGMGYDIQMEQFQHERLAQAILLGAQATQVVNRTKEYAKERDVFGSRLIEHQAVAFSLVSLETEIEMLRQMTYHCSELVMAGAECTREVAMAKYKAAVLVRRVVDECLQYLGAYGYMEEEYVARMFRDMRAASMAGGSVEMMQHILTKFL